MEESVMKNTVDKILNFMKFTEDDEYEEYDDFEEEYEEEEEKPARFSFFRKRDEEEDEYEDDIIEPSPKPTPIFKEPKKHRFISAGGNNKVVSMNTKGVEVYVIKPQDFSEAQTAADLLKQGRTVVINLEGVELTIAQRSIDFIGGATYAIDGSLQAVSNNIFIAAPDNIEVSGDLREEIMNDTIMAPQLK